MIVVSSPQAGGPYVKTKYWVLSGSVIFLVQFVLPGYISLTI